MKRDLFAAGGTPETLSSSALAALGRFGALDDRKVAALTLANLARLGDTVQKRSVLDVTFSLDTEQYASGDVLADTQEVESAVLDSGGTARLQSLVLVDKDDNTAAAIDLVFFSSNVSLGTENAAPSISDANCAKILGIVNVPSGSFVDVGGAKVATVSSIGLTLKAETGKSVYVAAITRGTPTQTASGITLKLAVDQF